LIACEGKGGGSSGGNGGNNGGGGNVELPPDPGSEGRKTLEGIDSNNNGIRDDVEIAIYEYAPKPEDEGVRQALIQTSRSLQAAILAASKDDINEVLKLDKSISRAVGCIMKKSPDTIKNTNELNMMQRLVANTDERAKAYIHFNGMLSGRILKGDNDPIPCDYDKENEANLNAAFKTQGQSINANLPPDPGAEGKKTLEGIDSNNDGLRDDVEIAIYNYAPRPDQERYRAALIQWAKALQKKIKVSSSKLDILLEVQRESNRASECIKKVSPGNGVEELKFLQKALHNTPQRDTADARFSKRIGTSGKDWWLPSGDPVPCDYDKK
jgi:hypothetical protein